MMHTFIAGMRELLLIFLFLFSIDSFSQDKLVLNSGEILYGKVWGIERELLVFGNKAGELKSFNSKDLDKVYLDEKTNKDLIRKIKSGRMSPYQRGQKTAKGRIGMGLLNFGAGFFSGSSGIIPIDGIQTEEMIRSENRKVSSSDDISFQAGYVEKAKRQNQRAFRMGFLGGVISNLICNPTGGFGTGPIRFSR